MKRDVMKEVDALKGEVTRLEERKVELKDSMVKVERIIAELTRLGLWGGTSPGLQCCITLRRNTVLRR